MNPSQLFRDNEIRSVGCNIEDEEQEGEHTSSSMQGFEREEQYRQFLQTIWQLSEQDGFPVVLREFDQVISLIRENRQLNQNELNRPYSILSVDWQGNFSTFDPELLSVSSKLYGTFDLASIRKISLMEAAKSERFQKLWKGMLSGVQRCAKECNYFGFCGGGMGSNKFSEHVSLNCSETNACRFNNKIPVDVLLDRFKSSPPVDHETPF